MWPRWYQDLIWPSALHNDCSRETLQCGCNLRRCRRFVASRLPIGTTSSKTKCVRPKNGRSLQHPKQTFAPAIVEDIRRTIVVLLLCVQLLVLTTALVENFPQTFSGHVCIQLCKVQASSFIHHVIKVKEFVWLSLIPSVFLTNDRYSVLYCIGLCA